MESRMRRREGASAPPPDRVRAVEGSRATRALGMLARAVVAPLTMDVDPPAPRARGRRRFTLLDIATAIVLYAVTAAALINASRHLAGAYPPQIMHLLAAAGTLPVALRRRRPLLAWQIVMVGIVITTGWYTPQLAGGRMIPLGGPPVFLPGQVIAFGLCLYTVASRGTRVVAVGAWLWSLVGLVVIATAAPNVALGEAPRVGSQDATLWTWSVIIVTFTPLFGSNVRTRRRAVADLASQQRRNEEERAVRARLEERSRIARELHDVVAHNMSVIAIQAEAAPLRTPGDADSLVAELAAIRTTALETLTEMRRVLGVLRAPDDQADTDPTPGIDQLDALVDKVSAAGLDVRISRTGAARVVPPGVGVSIYRIVQESLSNAMRHAPGSAVALTLAYSDAPPAVRLRVENSPPPGGPPHDDHPGPRHGLVGMRERAAMLRGDLVAEPTAGGGFVVEATLPLEDS